MLEAKIKVEKEKVRETARENLAELLETLMSIVSQYGKDISSYTIIELIKALREKQAYDYALSQAQKVSNVRIYKRHKEYKKEIINNFDF